MQRPVVWASNASRSSPTRRCSGFCTATFRQRGRNALETSSVIHAEICKQADIEYETLDGSL